MGLASGRVHMVSRIDGTLVDGFEPYVFIKDRSAY